jgi:drug/metabolite transporter (DMT)-like permease
MSGAVIAAISAAALFAVATALQHRSAGLVAGVGWGAETGPAAFVGRTVRHPLWIVGSVASLAGLALHTVALKDGPLTLVQPLLVIGVIFTLPLRQLLEHRRPRPAELAWAGVLALGLAVFLVLATPASHPEQAPDPGPAVVSLAVIGLVVGGCLVAGWRAPEATPPVLLGAAAGLAFAATAGLLKQTTNAFGHGTALLTTWPLYALITVGGAGLLLSQLAYRAGPLRVSLPAVTTVNPVFSVLIGVAVFDEPFRLAPGYLAGEVAGLMLMAVGAVGLTRIAADGQGGRPGRRGHPPGG